MMTDDEVATGVIVTLTPSEMMQGGLNGVMRHVAALKQGKADLHGAKGDERGWQLHIEGALGEIVLAKAENRFWPATVNTFRSKGDVGNLEIRTRSRDDYELIVRNRDLEQDGWEMKVFVLIVGCAPRYRVVGWCRGHEAVRGEWLRTHGGREQAYFVPQNALHPLPTPNVVEG